MDKVKKNLRKYIAWVALAALVITLAAMPLIARREEEASGPQASILTATAQSGDIRVWLRGGGVLEAGAPEAVTLPTGVLITGFLVKNGDMVTEGTPIATVDKVSVMNAIVLVQETMEYLQGQMEAAKDDTISQYISAKAGGRVKKIYAAPGEDAREVMLRDGALAVISLDGRMAVKLEEKTDLVTGDAVTVRFADGSETEGRVESNLSGELVVTFTDDGYEEGETVTVLTEEGGEIGSGELYIRNPWAVTAFSGTIQTVSIREEAVVYAGTTLFTMTDRDYTAEMETLSALHRDYEELLQDLFVMYRDGVVTASCDGMISGVDENSPLLLEEEPPVWGVAPAAHRTGGGSAGVYSMSGAVSAGSRDSGVRIVLLGEMPGDSGEGGDGTQNPPPAPPGGSEGGGEGGGEGGEGGEEPAPECTADENCKGQVHQPGCPLSGVTVTTYTGWIAKVVALGDGSTAMLRNPNAITTTSLSGMTIDETTLTEPYTYGASTYSDGTPIGVGDLVFLQQEGGILKIRGGAGGFGGFAGFSGFGFYGGAGGGAVAKPFEMFALEGNILLHVTPHDTMTLTVTVDERDISRVCVGQTAQVKIDALGDETYTAEVTKVGIHGTNAGGSSKFTAELTLERRGDMLAGMHATAAIPMESRENVLLIPVAALVEEGARTVVYTDYDKAGDKLLGPVEVTVGLSDGENVEILTGLEAGDRICYSYYDTLELSTEVESDKISFGR